MPDQENSIGGRELPPVYQMRIKGRLGRLWSEWFEGMTLTWDDDGDTLLTGPVVDQAALHGLLRRVRDLGMPLLSVTVVESHTPGDSDDAEPSR